MYVGGQKYVFANSDKEKVARVIHDAMAAENKARAKKIAGKATKADAPIEPVAEAKPKKKFTGKKKAGK
jgi:hypothetical protein